MPHAHGPGEQTLSDPRRRRHRVKDARTQLLVDTRHAGHDRRSHLLHIAAERVDRLGEHNGGACVEIEIDHHPLEHMTERQERQRRIVVRDVDYLVDIEHVRDQVVMREHHPFGVPGGTGGVDDGGQRVRVDRLAALLVAPTEPVLLHQPSVPMVDDLGQCPLARLDTLRPGGHDDDGLELGQPVSLSADFGRLKVVLHHHDPRTRIGQDVADLAGRQGCVHRDGHGAGGQRRQVGDGPLWAAVGQDRHPVTHLDTDTLEPQAEVADLVKHVAARSVLEPVANTVADEHGLGESARHMERQVREGPDERLGHPVPRRGFAPNPTRPLVGPPRPTPRPRGAHVRARAGLSSQPART